MKVIIDRAERLWKLPQPALGPMRFIHKRLAGRQVDVIDLETIRPEPPSPDLLSELSGSLPLSMAHEAANPDSISRLKAKIIEKHLSLKSTGIDPEKEIAIVPGVRMAAVFTSLALLNPGDVAAYPDPGAPYVRGAICLAEGNPRRYPLLESNDYITNISALAQTPFRKTKILFLNYPHNPSGAVVDIYFYSDLLKSIRSANILVLADCAHVHPGDPETAIPLQVKSGRLRALELHSFSTAFGISGLGFAAGHRDAISNLSSMLNRLGYAPGEKDLRLAKACLDRAEEIFATRMSNIHRRREILAEGLKKLGWRVRGSRTVPFIWAKHPARSTSVAFARRLFAKAGVRVAPGTDFGEAGEGWLRLSLSGDEKTLMEAVGRLSQHSRIWQRKYRPGA